MKFPQSGNKIWYNRAFLYWHRYAHDPDFSSELFFIMNELGFILPREGNP